MDGRAISKSTDRLKIAYEALEDMHKATNHETFSRAWYVFLTSSKNIWTLFEQGSKLSPQSMQWFGGKKKQRKESAVLQFMFEARNADEHGLEDALELQSSSLRFSYTGNTSELPKGFSFGSVKFNTETNEASLVGNGTDRSGIEVSVPLQSFEEVPPHSVLSAIRDRGGCIIHPPRDPDNTVEAVLPIKAASICLEYLEGLISEAARIAKP